MDTATTAKSKNSATESKAHGRELHLGNKLFQASVLDRIQQIVRDGATAAPWVVELDPTSACNLVCPNCISGSLLNKGGFDGDRLLALGHELVAAGVRAVILIGGGEPLAHPKVGELIRILGEGGVHIGITTNGTLIHRYLDVIAEHADWLRVSVDAGSPETFQYFRPSPSGVSRFQQVIENMANLAKVMKHGKLGMSYLILTEVRDDQTVARTNAGEIHQAAVLAKEIGCDYFEVKPSYDMNHFLIGQPRQVLDEVTRQIEMAKTLADETFRVMHPTNLGCVLENDLVEPKDYHRCLVSELRTLVTPHNSYICPYFRGVEEMGIGDAATSSFGEMWSGEARKQAMAKIDPARHCRFHCIRHGSNLLLEKMMAGDCEVTAIDDYDFFI